MLCLMHLKTQLAFLAAQAYCWDMLSLLSVNTARTFCWAALQAVISQSVLVFGITPSQTLVAILVKFHAVADGPMFQCT